MTNYPFYMVPSHTQSYYRFHKVLVATSTYLVNNIDDDHDDIFLDLLHYVVIMVASPLSSLPRGWRILMWSILYVMDNGPH